MDPARLRQALHAAADAFVDALVAEGPPAAKTPTKRRAGISNPVIPPVPVLDEVTRQRAVVALRRAGVHVPEELLQART